MSQEYRILAGYRETNLISSLDRIKTLLNISTPNSNNLNNLNNSPQNTINTRNSNTLFIDIGSGEGHVLEYMSNYCECLGIESDPLCIKKTKEKINMDNNNNNNNNQSENSNIKYRVNLYEGNAETFLFRDYCQHYDNIVVYMFLSSFGYSIMGRILLNQLPIGSRIVTVASPIGSYWKPLCAWLGNNDDLILYLHIVTSDIIQSSLKSTIPIQEIRWKHPPPGSYFPQPLRNDIPLISYETSAFDISHLCQDFLNNLQNINKHTEENEIKWCDNIKEENIESKDSEEITTSNITLTTINDIIIEERIVDKKLKIPPPPPLPPFLRLNKK